MLEIVLVAAGVVLVIVMLALARHADDAFPGAWRGPFGRLLDLIDRSLLLRIVRRASGRSERTRHEVILGPFERTIAQRMAASAGRAASGRAVAGHPARQPVRRSRRQAAGLIVALATFSLAGLGAIQAGPRGDVQELVSTPRPDMAFEPAGSEASDRVMPAPASGAALSPGSETPEGLAPPAQAVSSPAIPPGPLITASNPRPTSASTRSPRPEATPAPTPAPTTAPTPAPTTAPTTAPTPAPTRELDAAFTCVVVGLSIVCDGSASTGATTYTWTFERGPTVEGVIAGHLYDDPGRYLVRLVVSDGSSTDRAERRYRVGL